MSAAVDIYSFGIMMWEVFTAQPAFKHLHYGQCAGGSLAGRAPAAVQTLCSAAQLSQPSMLAGSD